jgi:hypothetical protein
MFVVDDDDDDDCSGCNSWYEGTVFLSFISFKIPLIFLNTSFVSKSLVYIFLTYLRHD